MIIKKKNIFSIAFTLFAFVLIYLFWFQIIPKIRISRCPQIYADKIIELPSLDENNIGFTGTGLFWDESNSTFIVGNAGKFKPNDNTFRATIEVVDQNFLTIKQSIPCYLSFKNMRDIQGVTKSTDGSIWFSSYGENMIRHIDIYGNEINSFSIIKPSGIANDTRDKTLWILSNYYLYHCTYDGNILERVKVRIKGQDQLYLDENANLLYFSAGTNYGGDNYIYTINLETYEIQPSYVLKDSYAIEGISIVNGVLYVLNDGYYHNAAISVNQVNIYYLN